jgi:hypothetical protein
MTDLNTMSKTILSLNGKVPSALLYLHIPKTTLQEDLNSFISAHSLFRFTFLTFQISKCKCAVNTVPFNVRYSELSVPYT